MRHCRYDWFGVVLQLIAATALSAPAAAADEAIAILPSQFTLSGRDARQPVIVERVAADGRLIGQAPIEQVTFAVSDPKVCKVTAGVLEPVADGTATLTATYNGATAQATLTVTNFARPTAWSFRTHVESVFSKAGCNGGGCHGALAGKKGFKLSLAAYDPVADYFNITHQARSRRIVLEDPARSLLLTKPTGAVPHKGGVRFDPGSPQYKIIAEWIAAGAPAPNDDDPRLTKLEILPDKVSLQPGAKQQLVVMATFSDGHQEDVTRWARYLSTLESVAQVGELGGVSVSGPGEAAIKAWYSSWNVVATVSVAYPQSVAAAAFQSSPAGNGNFIDELVLAKLASLNLPPSPAATDGEFIRRAYLDTLGILPTVAETTAYLADKSPDKREKLVEELLARPEFVDYWAYKWSDLLLVSSEKLRPPAMWAYYTWIHNAVAANLPWDEFARQLVTASGSTLENGAANFFVLHPDPLDAAETVSMAFLGMSINCARCHNHPLEKWTNDQYFAMANLFSRVRSKDGAGDGNRVVFPVLLGELVQPRTGKPQPPQPLDGEALALDSPVDRRAHAAAWLTAPQNPYFSRAVTNRVWANFFGVGLVEGVDDLRLTNPPSNAGLMDAAARYLVDHGYDLKALMRAILLSQAYGRSSVPLKENTPDQRFYSRYYPRRLMAEVLLDAVTQVTGTSDDFVTATQRGQPAGFQYPRGWRALQLPDANVKSQFLQSFGRPERTITCECERSAEPSMTQALHLSNGDTINQKLSAKENRISRQLAAGLSNDQIIDELYLAALARMPTAGERSKLTAELSAAGPAERRAVIEDIYWSVLASKEFLFQH